jgi:peptide/nickel transport system substrate-binding protein
VNTLEPVRLELVEVVEILANVFEPLLATDRNGNLVPNLCEKWEVSENGKVVTLTLRNDIRFQDGHRLTAADVKKSFERSVRLINAEAPPAIVAIRGAAEFAGWRGC